MDKDAMSTIDWSRIPAFIREAVQTFPFYNPRDGNEFLHLLTSRATSIIATSPPVGHESAATDSRADWSWDLYHEMLAGAAFVGRCLLSNWRLEVPDLYREIYLAVVERPMFDNDRTAHLKELINLPCHASVLHFPGFPWEVGGSEMKTGSLEMALRKYQRQQAPIIPDFSTRLPRELVPSLIKAQEDLTSLKDALERISDNCRASNRSGNLLVPILGRLEDRFLAEYCKE